MPENDELKKYLDYDGLDYLIKRIPRTRIIVTFDDVFAGETATCSLGTTIYTNTVPVTEPYQLVFSVVELGTWTIATSYLGDDYETTVEVTGVGTTATGHISYVSEIDGATVEPTDDITTWLKCANIEDPSITTLADVLADRSLFETLIANSNACKYMARSTSWAGALNSVSGLVPTMTSNTTPSGQVEGGPAINGQYPAYRAFDGDDTTQTVLQQANTTGYVQYDFPEAKNIRSFSYLIKSSSTQGITLNISCSDDNSTFASCGSYRYEASYINSTKFFVLNDDYGSHRYWRLTRVLDSTAWSDIAHTVQFYDVVDITHSQDAMSLIGKYDYCSNELLNNAAWCEAIANSDYLESVFNVKVPAMTSATTPTGEVIESSHFGSDVGWKAFDGDDSTYWNCANLTNGYLIYKFTEAKKIKSVRYSSLLSTNNLPRSITISGSNDNSSYTLIKTFEASQVVGSNVIDLSNNDTAYLYYRFYVSASYASSSFVINTLQFYGRKTNEVLISLVPTMTSDTTPSGRIMYSSASNGGDYKTYGLFDNNTSSMWMPTNESTYGENNAWCGYDFGKQVIACRYTIYHTMNRLSGWNIEGSNDGETWTVLDSKTNQSITNPPVLLTYDIPSENQGSYRYLRLRHTSSLVGTPSSTPIGELQFYQKQVQTNIIHSAANDTIYMMNNGTQVPLCTTNSNGDGILDFSQFMNGTYTLYSSVAKDPTNLSNDFSKSIRITKTSYGCTTEAYIVPDTIKTLYWYGNILEKWQDCNPNNGWSISISGYTIYNNTSYNTNDINIWSTTSRGNGCGSFNKLLLKKVHFIGKITNTVWGLYAKATKTKVLDGSNTINIDQQNVVMYKSADVTQDYYYLIISIYDDRNGNAYALWYE